MLNTIFTLLKGFITLFKVPAIILFSIVLIFYFLVFVNLIIERIHGKKIKKGSKKFVPRPSFLKKLFFELPKRYVSDLLERDPDYFHYQGLIVYEGRQGSGKTSTMIYDTMYIQKEYPKCKVITNLNYKNEDDVLDDWHKLIDYKNGIFGIVAVLDELQNWFSSNQSKNFPPEMLQVITQNRKNRRVIFGTSQNFYLLAKAIRSQCTEVRQCLTVLGCLTVVRRRIPILDSEGNVTEWKNRGFYWYVHTKELREAYDTYKVIESLSKSGFQPRVQEPENNVYIISTEDKKRAKK